MVGVVRKPAREEGVWGEKTWGEERGGSGGRRGRALKQGRGGPGREAAAGAGEREREWPSPSPRLSCSLSRSSPSSRKRRARLLTKRAEGPRLGAQPRLKGDLCVLPGAGGALRLRRVVAGHCFLFGREGQKERENARARFFAQTLRSHAGFDRASLRRRPQRGTVLCSKEQSSRKGDWDGGARGRKCAQKKRPLQTFPF